jgi:cyclase
MVEPPVQQEIAPGIYAYIQPDGSWWLNNTGFVLGRSGVLALDSCSTEARTRALLDAIGARSPQPVRTLVNTHHHGDHTHGNYLFAAAGAIVVGHEECRRQIVAAGLPGPAHAAVWEAPEWGAIELAPPTVTFTDTATLWVDELRCEVRYVGTPAHTTNDCVLWVPEHSVLFAGDLLFNGGTPFLLMGSIAGALEAVAALADIGAERIVPGHGPVCDPGQIEPTLAYLRFVTEVARDGHAAGRPPLEQARRTELGEFAALTDAERIVGNLHRAYAELDGAERGAPIDVPAALVDMVAFNGGRLHCYA